MQVDDKIAIAEMERLERKYGTAKAAADAIGYTESYWSLLKRRKRPFTPEIIEALGLDAVMIITRPEAERA